MNALLSAGYFWCFLAVVSSSRRRRRRSTTAAAAVAVVENLWFCGLGFSNE